MAICQPSVRARYDCGHDEVVDINDVVRINNETLKIEPDPENRGKYLIEFTYDAHVVGSFTLRFGAKLGRGYNNNLTKEDLIPPVTVDIQQGVGMQFKQKSGTGIDLSLCKISEPFSIPTQAHAYVLGIRVDLSQCISEDGSTNRGTTISQLTTARFEKEMGVYKVTVTSETLQVNRVRYTLYDIYACAGVDGGDLNWNDLGKKCLICLSKFQDTTSLHSEGQKIGKLLVYKKEIGNGSNGTIVFEGIHDNRSVAVKKIAKVPHHDEALKVIQNQLKSDQHGNIVKLYGTECDQDFVYIALERCVCSLHDLILSHRYSSVDLQPTVKVFKEFQLWSPNRYPSPILSRIMSDIVGGLAYLHNLRMNHGELKPRNVLMLTNTGDPFPTEIVAKLSDMYNRKYRHDDQYSLTKSTIGWQAPELLRNEERKPTADLFSLGILLFFCITCGRHPFCDDIDECDTRVLMNNILYDRKNLFLVENIPEAFDLISRLLDRDPDSRPTAAEVYNHPILWDPDKRLSFIRIVGEQVKLHDNRIGSNLRASLNEKHSLIFDDGWNNKLDITLLNDIERPRQRKYKYDSVCDLLRLIRNKYNHYGESSGELRKALGSFTTGFEEYFSSRFPKLLIEVHKVMKNYGEEEALYKYYKHWPL